VRNSSLVEWSCADNVAGLKPITEAVAVSFMTDWVGERSLAQRRPGVSLVGAEGRANAGMSSETPMRNRGTVNLRFPTEG
jgi:hypothetical protein